MEINFNQYSVNFFKEIEKSEIIYKSNYIYNDENLNKKQKTVTILKSSDIFEIVENLFEKKKYDKFSIIKSNEKLYIIKFNINKIEK